MDRIMWLSRATARLLTQLPTFSVRKLPTSKGRIFVCYRVSLCTNMTFLKTFMKGSNAVVGSTDHSIATFHERFSFTIADVSLAAGGEWQ
jgi:hypothetical protein